MTATLPETKAAPITSDDIRRERLARRIDAAILKCRNSDTITKEKMPDDQAAARQRAKHIYQAAVLAAAAALAEKNKASEKRKKDDEAAVLLLLLLAGEDAYRETHGTLVPGADHSQVDEQAKTFAEQRQSVLGKFSEKLVKNIRQAQKESTDEKLGETEAARAIRQRAANTGEVMADTEAQVTLGSVQIDRLKRAGMTHKIWQTCEDERVRDSHENCQLQGAIPLDRLFGNGLAYPGDPRGQPEDLCNCRCWLVGIKK